MLFITLSPVTAVAGADQVGFWPFPFSPAALAGGDYLRLKSLT